MGFPWMRLLSSELHSSAIKLRLGQVVLEVVALQPVYGKVFLGLIGTWKYREENSVVCCRKATLI